VKIGWAFDIPDRARRLQTGNSRKLNVVGFIPGTRHTEATLHKEFSDRRLNGEWFDDEDRLIQDSFACARCALTEAA
jgi:hypothetical protein